MTTIAYRDGIVATDNRVIFDERIHVYDVHKIIKTKTGKIAGATGIVSCCNTFLRWAKDPGNTSCPIVNDNCIGFTVDKKGRIRIYDCHGGHDIDLPYGFFAMGSGQAPALAAMHMGATAIQAIEVTAKVCTFTGADVKALRL